MKQEMNTIIPPPEREQFEREIANLFVNGDLSDIARLLQKDVSNVSRAFSPFSDDKLNPVYQFVLHLWAFDAIRDDLAGEVLNIVLREREKWQTRPSVKPSPVELSGNVGHQFIEAMECEIAGESTDKQAKEWYDVELAAREKRLTLNALANAEHFETWHGRKA